MRVKSTYVGPFFDSEMGEKLLLMVFDTLVDDRSIVVGITVGEVGLTLDDLLLSSVGHKVMNQVIRHQKLNYSQTDPVIFAGVQYVSSAIQRTRNILSKAPHGAALMIVCADHKVYNAAVPALNIDSQSAKMYPQ